MSRLYALARRIEELSEHFEITSQQDIDVPREFVEGVRGPIIIERDGTRLLKTASWGFPRLKPDGRDVEEGAHRIGLVADLTNPLWDRVAVNPLYRCLIPLSHFAYPEGAEGRKTRAWISRMDGSLMAWAGLVKNSPEYGPVYAGLTRESNEVVFPLNERMPLVVMPNDYDRWLRGSISDVISLQFGPPPQAGRFEVTHTKNRWCSGIAPRATHSQIQPSMVI